MVFLLGNIGTDEYTVLGTRVALRPLRMSDYAAWEQLRSSSRAHLTPFEPQWSDSELTRVSFRLRVKAHQREIAEDAGYAFGIYQPGPDKLLGGVSLSNVRRGVTQSAELGYWLGAAHIGKGYMTEAVRIVIEHAFGPLGLHRLEAATLPHNGASIRVLERNGFRREGHARSYLRINGVWQDHLLFGLIQDDMRVSDEATTRPALSAAGE